MNDYGLDLFYPNEVKPVLHLINGGLNGFISIDGNRKCDHSPLIKDLYLSITNKMIPICPDCKISTKIVKKEIQKPIAVFIDNPAKKESGEYYVKYKDAEIFPHILLFKPKIEYANIITDKEIITKMIISLYNDHKYQKDFGIWDPTKKYVEIFIDNEYVVEINYFVEQYIEKKLEDEWKSYDVVSVVVRE